MLTEGAKLTMVLAHGVKQIIDNWLEKQERKAREKEAAAIAKGREQGLEQGRTQGQAEANKAWQDWLARKEDAESRGQPFTEPPPNANPE